MAQATRARSVGFRIRLRSGLRVSSAILFTKEKRKETLKNRKNFNEFSKSSTKSCMSRTMNNLKESFTLSEINNNKKNNIENDDSMLRYTYVRYMLFKKPYKKKFY